MEILSNTTAYLHPVCLALGFFDCVHTGHAALLRKLREQAEKCGARACVATFVSNPRSALGGSEKSIFTFRERLRLFAELQMDCVLPLPSDLAFLRKSKDEFLRYLQALLPELRGVVCGYDYRFGANAAGNSRDLAEFAQINSIMCDVQPSFMQNGLRVSATAVRERLQNGDLQQAETLMGHGYFITGQVLHGRGVGKSFGYPTANVQTDKEKLLPLAGVYATYATADGKTYRSVTNVGQKPTFGVKSVTVETLLSDFDGDLYGKEITVSFVRRLRDITAFSSPQELKEQIDKDAKWR